MAFLFQTMPKTFRSFFHLRNRLDTNDTSLLLRYISECSHLLTGKVLSFFHVSSNINMASELDLDFD